MLIKSRQCVLLLLIMLICHAPAFAASGTYPKIEASFELSEIAGNPFDFTVNDVEVSISDPNGNAITVPAFFDGGMTWRIRYTPTQSGEYKVRSVALNGRIAQTAKPLPETFEVSGKAAHGFVRIDPKQARRFFFDDGWPYYPIGYDLAWHHTGEPQMPPLTESLRRMNAARVNWSRIWMCYWDGKNLDWTQSKNDQPVLGELDLKVARRWDEIVDAAAANGVYFQIVLQHHGQFSTRADANWQLNPWNKANGGWLENSVQFFSDPKAIALTKSKYRYIIARWGYSPAIMAWELFNEVENADAFSRDLNSVANWHEQMAQFIRGQDSNHHLITTSSNTRESKLWPAMDYYQAHVYAPDLISAVANLDAEKLQKPYFYGEFGSAESEADANPFETIHKTLWASLMSGSSGTAQYWFWYIAEPKNLLSNYTSAQNFLEQSSVLQQSDLKPLDVSVRTKERGPLRFGPGHGWGSSKSTEFTVRSDGHVEGLTGMSAFLQGKGANHETFPSATFNVDYAVAGSFAIHVDQMTPSGARLIASVDGQRVVSVDFNGPATQPAAQSRNGARRDARLDSTIEIPIPAGKHAVRLENDGADWIHLRDFTLTPYAQALAVLAKGRTDFAILWVYRRNSDEPNGVAGEVFIPGIRAGSYEVTWWDTIQGKMLKQNRVDSTDSTGITLQTPNVTKDVAAWIQHLLPPD